MGDGAGVWAVSEWRFGGQLAKQRSAVLLHTPGRPPATPPFRPPCRPALPPITAAPRACGRWWRAPRRPASCCACWRSTTSAAWRRASTTARARSCAPCASGACPLPPCCRVGGTRGAAASGVRSCAASLPVRWRMRWGAGTSAGLPAVEARAGTASAAPAPYRPPCPPVLPLSLPPVALPAPASHCPAASGSAARTARRRPRSSSRCWWRSTSAPRVRASVVGGAQAGLAR